MITEVFDEKVIWAEAKEQLKDVVLPVWLDTIDVAGCDDGKFRLVSVHALAPQVVKQNYYKKIVEKCYNFFLHNFTKKGNAIIRKIKNWRLVWKNT